MAEPTPEAAAAPEARPVPVANPWIAALCAWLVPGAGHWYLGRRRRALAFLLLVAVALALGLALHGNLYRPLPGQPLTYLGTLGSMGLGLGYLLLRYAGYTGEVIAPGYEYGTAFILTAGLMNLLLVLDAWDIALGKKD
ncbi:MAG TPA: DUF6677 family protein [Thermoanaerobaculia bacterium]|nr:DUF6677 family protein [Thermoanaerobaculia bacterium]